MNSKEIESEIEFGIELIFSGGTMSQTANWIARPPRVRHASASNRRASATRPPRPQQKKTKEPQRTRSSAMQALRCSKKTFMK
ncbi:MAG: hypothetical protein VYB01_07265 [Pseudomonadota bacterium]|nr:hypothetical protein [Pseudomonadota bacterium]